MTRVIYISGPMTGYPDFNRPMFRDVAHWLEVVHLGPDDSVLSPVTITQDESEDGIHTADKPYDFYLRQAVIMQMQANETVMLEGWTKSKGARIEFNLALDLGMKVWLLSTHTVAATGQPVLWSIT